MKNPKLMKRKELIAEVERLRTGAKPTSEEQYIDKADALGLSVLRVRYRLMKVALREKIAKDDPIFHNILMEQRVTKD